MKRHKSFLNNKVFPVALLIGILLLFNSTVSKARKNTAAKVLYGFSKSHPIIKGKSDDDIIRWIKAMGFNGVFCRSRDKIFIKKYAFSTAQSQ